MLQAKLCCMPVDIKIKTRMIGFWQKIVNSKDAKFSKILYKFLLTEFENGTYQHKWINYLLRHSNLCGPR